MNISKIYKLISLLNPRIEVLLRHIFWYNINVLKRFNPYKIKHKEENTINSTVDFDNVISFLKSQGIGEGSLLLVHSSYAALENSGLSPDEIINKLLELIGSKGTLAMPVIRHFKGEKKTYEKLKDYMDDLVLIYDVCNTKITSGMLPYYLMIRKNAHTSLFPINPLCAVGELAEPMMANNLLGENPSPHGPNSSWKFCYDNDAFVVGLGVSLEHYNTSIHIAEEAFKDWKYSNDEWYNKRKFKIIDKNGNMFEKTVLERKPKWGMLHFAENNLNRDLRKNQITTNVIIDGLIPVTIEKQRVLVDFLRSRNRNGYPYF